jgi:hypothetical protein
MSCVVWTVLGGFVLKDSSLGLMTHDAMAGDEARHPPPSSFCVIAGLRVLFRGLSCGTHGRA